MRTYEMHKIYPEFLSNFIVIFIKSLEGIERLWEKFCQPGKKNMVNEDVDDSIFLSISLKVLRISKDLASPNFNPFPFHRT